MSSDCEISGENSDVSSKASQMATSKYYVVQAHERMVQMSRDFFSLSMEQQSNLDRFIEEWESNEKILGKCKKMSSALSKDLKSEKEKSSELQKKLNECEKRIEEQIQKLIVVDERDQDLEEENEHLKNTIKDKNATIEKLKETLDSERRQKERVMEKYSDYRCKVTNVTNNLKTMLIELGSEPADADENLRKCRGELSEVALLAENLHRFCIAVRNPLRYYDKTFEAFETSCISEIESCVDGDSNEVDDMTEQNFPELPPPLSPHTPGVEATSRESSLQKEDDESELSDNANSASCVAVKPTGSESERSGDSNRIGRRISIDEKQNRSKGYVAHCSKTVNSTQQNLKLKQRQTRQQAQVGSSPIAKKRFHSSEPDADGNCNNIHIRSSTSVENSNYSDRNLSERVHHGESFPLKCSICEKLFKYQTSLKKHLERAHPATT